MFGGSKMVFGLKSLCAAATVVVALMTFELTGGHLAATASPPSSSVASQFEVQVGSEQLVSGPNDMIDTPYFSERDAGGKLVGFSGNAASVEYPTKGNASLGKGRVILKKGGRGTFDGCGAWLSSIYKMPVNGKPSNHWVGWYHAESAGVGMAGMCNYANQSTIWRIAYVESWDSGRTWTKPSYPDNKVITQDTALTGPVTGDAGNPRVIAVGSYFYLFYQAATRDQDVRLLNVARAPISQMGRPGTWSKYYCQPTDLTVKSCGFTEPGIGGRSTALRNIPPSSRFVIWNSYLNRYIAPMASGRNGFTLRVADETGIGNVPLTWSSAASIYPPVSTTSDTLVDDWTARTPKSKQLYAYPSLLGSYGSSSVTGQSFYLYYMKIFPGGGFEQRNLFRRKVWLRKTDDLSYNRVQLTTYVNASGRRISSTEVPKAPSYHVATSAGYLLAAQRTGWNEMFSCAGAHGDNFLGVGGCAGRVKIRRVGWISPSLTSKATVAIYSCYDAKLKRHFASSSQACSGQTDLGLLGYGLPAIA
ncbi:hypothetical protein GCM10027076_23800 [Nocardioides montaniterrae]